MICLIYTKFIIMRMIQADAIFVERSYQKQKSQKRISFFHTHDSLSISHEGLADRA